MGLSKIVQFRVSPEEAKAYQAEAKRREMELSQWIRSACATFIIHGKTTVLVPAGKEPAYVEDLRRGARAQKEGIVTASTRLDGGERHISGGAAVAAAVAAASVTGAKTVVLHGSDVILPAREDRNGVFAEVHRAAVDGIFGADIDPDGMDGIGGTNGSLPENVSHETPGADIVTDQPPNERSSTEESKPPYADEE